VLEDIAEFLGHRDARSVGIYAKYDARSLIRRGAVRRRYSGSRPFFIKLLEAGVMAHHRIGNQQRVYLRDGLAYGRKQDEDRKASLDRLSQNAVEAGLYDRNVRPEGGQDE
jgi:hypothetical protein